jgi:hypothetical protein
VLASEWLGVLQGYATYSIAILPAQAARTARSAPSAQTEPGFPRAPFPITANRPNPLSADVGCLMLRFEVRCSRFKVQRSRLPPRSPLRPQALTLKPPHATMLDAWASDFIRV